MHGWGTSCEGSWVSFSEGAQRKTAHQDPRSVKSRVPHGKLTEHTRKVTDPTPWGGLDSRSRIRRCRANQGTDPTMAPRRVTLRDSEVNSGRHMFQKAWAATRASSPRKTQVPAKDSKCPGGSVHLSTQVTLKVSLLHLPPPHPGKPQGLPAVLLPIKAAALEPTTFPDSFGYYVQNSLSTKKSS